MIDSKRPDDSGKNELSLDCIVDRIVDRRANLEDWHSFDARLEATPTLAHELVQRLREDDTLRASLAPVRSAAENVELPRMPARSAWARPSFLSGFAAALLLGIAVALLLTDTRTRSTNATPTDPDSTSKSSSAEVDDLYQRYVALGRQEGRVIEELPSVPISMERDSEDANAVQVVFVRRIVERTRVDKVTRFGSDEHGHSVALPTKQIDKFLARDI